jgi:hypothetical protein
MYIDLIYYSTKPTKLQKKSKTPKTPTKKKTTPLIKLP